MEKINNQELEQQWQRALSKGWVDAALRVARKCNIDAATLLAIASRESNLDPRYLKMPGDNGNAFGLMQIDKRAHPAHIESGAWQRAEANMGYAACSVLAPLRAAVLAKRGKTLTIKDPTSGKPYSVNIPAAIPEADLERICAAGYNCGYWALYHYAKGRSPDYATTGKDYSADTIGRRKPFFERRIKEYLTQKERDSAPQLGAASLLDNAAVIAAETLSRASTRALIKRACLRISALIAGAWALGIQHKIVLVLCGLCAIYLIYISRAEVVRFFSSALKFTKNGFK